MEELKIKDILDGIVRSKDDEMTVREWIKESILSTNDYVSELKRELKENEYQLIG